MTRLVAGDIESIPRTLVADDHGLRRLTGFDLKQLACFAAGVDEERAARRAAAVYFSVIPITSGQGVIPGFSESVRAILRHLGFKATVTRYPDVAGMAEAVVGTAEVLIMADDHRFAAMNLKTRRVVDNAEATGRGFVAGLDRMAGGLAGAPVLVLGCGPVGQGAVKALVRLGARVTVLDISQARARALATGMARNHGVAIRVADCLDEALKHHPCLLDATPRAGFIDHTAIRKDARVAAPGVPLGLTRAALEKIGGRCLHDPLQIGTATMAMSAAFGDRLQARCFL